MLCRSSTVRPQTCATCSPYGAHQKCSTTPMSYRRPRCARSDLTSETREAVHQRRHLARHATTFRRRAPRSCGRAPASRTTHTRRTSPAGNCGPGRARPAGGTRSGPRHTGAPGSAAAKPCAARRRPPEGRGIPRPEPAPMRAFQRPKRLLRLLVHLVSQAGGPFPGKLPRARSSERAPRSALHSGRAAASRMARASSRGVSA